MSDSPVRYFVPLDGHVHALQLGSEPVDLAIADMGITFSAEPGDRRRALRVFTSSEGLPGGHFELVGEASRHGLCWYLYDLAG